MSDVNPPPDDSAPAPRRLATPRATWALCAINVLVFAAQLYFSKRGGGLFGSISEEVLMAGGNHPPGIWNGEWWRLLTSAFLHGNLPHLAVNVYSLWVLGSLLEPMLKPARTLVLYGASALLASAASVAITVAPVSVGASGAVFGFAGALLSITLLARERAAAREMARRLVTVILLNLGAGVLFNGVAQGVKIDNVAHVGGLVGGMLIGLAMVSAQARGALAPLTIAGAGGFGVLFAVALGMATHPRDNMAFHAAAAEVALVEGRLDAAMTTVKSRLRENPHDPRLLAVGYRACAIQADPCAMELLQRLLTLEPLPPSGTSQVDANELRAVLYKTGMKAVEEEDWGLAAQTFGRGSTLWPDDAMAANNHAWALLQLPNVSPDTRTLALAQADRARRLTDGNDANINHTYAIALHRNGRSEEALEVLQGMLNTVEDSLGATIGAATSGVDADMLRQEIERIRREREPAAPPADDGPRAQTVEADGGLTQ